jgi:hypothetical protein
VITEQELLLDCLRRLNGLDNRSALKVDFWVLRREAFEQQMFDRRKKVDFFGQTAWISTAEDILPHKLYWHRSTPPALWLCNKTISTLGIYDGGRASWESRKRCHERMWSSIAIRTKQGGSFFEFLHESITAHRVGQTPPFALAQLTTVP